MRRSALLAGLVLAAQCHATDEHPLEWLAGCWSTPGGNAVEVWRVDGDELAGFAVTVNAGRVQSYETLAIRRSSGKYVYTAWPSKQRETSFTVESIEPNAVRFTNPGHDYPQVIAYRRDGNTLTATISMLDGSIARRFEKLRCEDVGD